MLFIVLVVSLPSLPGRAGAATPLTVAGAHCFVKSPAPQAPPPCQRVQDLSPDSGRFCLVPCWARLPVPSAPRPAPPLLWALGIQPAGQPPPPPPSGRVAPPALSHASPPTFPLLCCLFMPAPRPRWRPSPQRPVPPLPVSYSPGWFYLPTCTLDQPRWSSRPNPPAVLPPRPGPPVADPFFLPRVIFLLLPTSGPPPPPLSSIQMGATEHWSLPAASTDPPMSPL
ncbi:unnamed protein product [Pleuronectes platessa]|uniref:Uncharacterized protein n=1 Tax=Pleuronectes platessa TaxID=8262 RepID=A0A9N7ZDQ7_PLEPL|nr:unnamed protein product [Pleuronectes platessa]